MVVRSYDDECAYLERQGPNTWRIKKGFQVRADDVVRHRVRFLDIFLVQPNMNVEGVFYVNAKLEKLMFDELKNACRPGMVGGFLPGETFDGRF